MILTLIIFECKTNLYKYVDLPSLWLEDISSILLTKGESKMQKTLEIRSAEGGEDAKLFVNDLAEIYERTFLKLG